MAHRCRALFDLDLSFKQTENAQIQHLSEYNDEPRDLQTDRERGEKGGRKVGSLSVTHTGRISF